MALDPSTVAALIEAHVGCTKDEAHDWDAYRAMYRCENWGASRPAPGTDPAPLLTESGSLYAFVDSMVASVVPPNPQVTCRARRSALRGAARYREALVNDVFDRERVHRLLWTMATHASVYPRAAVKAVWNLGRRRPEFVVLDPRNFYFDLTAVRWEDVRYCIEATVLTRAEFAERVPEKRRRSGSGRIYDPNVAHKAQFGSFPAWLRSASSGRAEVGDKLRKVFEWVTIFEVFDFTTPGGRYFHMLENIKLPLYEGDLPYAFVRNPFRLLEFSDNLEDQGGMADAKVVAGPIRRLDELRTLKLRFAQATIPITLLNTSNVDDPEHTKAQIAKATSPGDVAEIKAKNGMTIADVVGQTPTAALSPAFDAIDRTLQEEILYRLGMPQYIGGKGGTSELATELALMDAALRTRQGRRSKQIDDVVVFMAKSVIGLYEQFLRPDDTLPVRLGGKEYLELMRAHLAARNPEDAGAAQQAGATIEDPMDVDYEVVPYSPVENSKTAQLKKFAEFAKLLFSPVAPPEVQRAALAKVLDLLDIDVELPEVLPQPPAPPGPPQQPGGPAPGTEGEEMNTPTEAALKGGGLPRSVPPIPVGTGATGAMVGGAGYATPRLPIGPV